MNHYIYNVKHKNYMNKAIKITKAEKLLRELQKSKPICFYWYCALLKIQFRVHIRFFCCCPCVSFV